MPDSSDHILPENEFIYAIVEAYLKQQEPLLSPAELQDRFEKLMEKLTLPKEEQQ